jgi:hemolysin III
MNANATNQTSKDGSRHATDEQMNTCTHLAGAVFSLMGMVLLVVYAGIAGKPWHIVGFSIYGCSLISLFMASTLHHGVNASEKAEDTLRSLDYAAIFLLIAGTMTPVCLTVLRGPLGWSLFGVAWAVAAAGIILKILFPNIPKSITNTLYFTMGWLGIFTAWPVYRNFSWQGLSILALGGIIYSAGAVVFAIEKPNPLPGKFGFHEIWHLFVMTAAVTHFIFMWLYILPF